MLGTEQERRLLYKAKGQDKIYKYTLVRGNQGIPGNSKEAEGVAGEQKRM